MYKKKVKPHNQSAFGYKAFFLIVLIVVFFTSGFAWNYFMDKPKGPDNQLKSAVPEFVSLFSNIISTKVKPIFVHRQSDESKTIFFDKSKSLGNFSVKELEAQSELLQGLDISAVFVGKVANIKRSEGEHNFLELTLTNNVDRSIVISLSKKEAETAKVTLVNLKNEQLKYELVSFDQISVEDYLVIKKSQDLLVKSDNFNYNIDIIRKP